MAEKPEFSELVVSLAQSVYVMLGIVEDPFSKQKKIDLKQAKYTIDMLDMLREKTKGNLTEDEKRLLDDVIYDLKTKYLYAMDSSKK